jgi:sec-independent protein translocase protein TatC
MQDRMTLSEHLEELRRRVIWGLLAIACGFGVCLAYRGLCLRVVTYPHRQVMERMGQPADLYVFRYQENFVTQMKVCFIMGVFISSPIVVYQIWRFIGAGLSSNERRAALVFIPAVGFCFLAGCCFGYFLLVPLGLRFLADFGREVGVTSMINLGEYLSFFSVLTLTTGVIFEVPVVLWLLGRFGLIRSETLRSQRRMVILAAFIVAAFLTPTTDPVTQALMAVPLVFLFEIGLWAMLWEERKRPSAAEPAMDLTPEDESVYRRGDT